MKTTRPQTPNRGADDERAAILRKIRAMDREADCDCLKELAAWIQARHARVDKRSGGLGKKK